VIQADSILELNNIEVRYSEAMPVLKDVSISVPQQGIVALLGANGAGKSTALKAISGLLRHENGAVTDGTIEFLEERIDKLTAGEIAKRGIFQIMEGRRVFERLTVEENLMAGAHLLSSGLQDQLDLVYYYFQRLHDKRHVVAENISSGEQQMCVLGRVLMARPKLMLLDELSMGLTPLLINEIFETIERLNQEEGISILLAEQNAKLALNISEYAYVIENGRVQMEGPSERLREHPDIMSFYLGLIDVGGGKSFHDVINYKQRKRGMLPSM